MEINITMLNVEDGDAIVVELTEGIKKGVILIDAGRRGFADNVISKMDEILKTANKIGPDLVVVTHYDSDHIGGISQVINKYGNNIGELWIHNPIFKTNEVLNSLYLKPKMIALAKEASAKKMQVVIESVNELNDVMARANEVGIKKIVEPFLGECNLAGWPTLKVLGPTRAYYKDVFKNIITAEAFIQSESDGLIFEESCSTITASNNPCGQLPKTSKITATNQVSVIIKITVNSNSYLFTGDAGIESFKEIPNYKEELKNVYWLKAPHHGSINNMSAELVSLMKPKHLYVSGNEYVDEAVVNCFRDKGSEVKITTSGDLTFSSIKYRMREYLGRL